MFERMRRGWELTKKAWGVVRSHPGLTKLPLTGGALALVAVIVFGGPGALLISIDNTGTKVLGGILLVAAAYFASFFVIYYNVALAAGADQALRGQEPDIAKAKGVARGRIGVIAKWAAVSAAISLLLSVVRDRGGFAGDIIAGIGGAIWSLITFLVVPVLAFEGIGPFDAIKRSAHLFRQRWGQQVTGNVVIGGVAGLAVFLGVAIGVVGVVVMAAGDAAMIALGAVLLMIGVVAAIGGAVFGGATRGVFGVALYHYVAENQVVGPFTAPDMEGTARTSKR